MNELFDITKESGLSGIEVSRRLAEEGYNEIPSAKKRSIFYIAFEVIREPMFLLLVACGILYFMMGEPADAVMLMGFVLVVMGITIFQERRTERALEALRDLSSPRALVIRNGQQNRIPGREVVRGDLMLLAEGDRVPADAVLRHSVNLSADESLLTGESVPVRKKATSESKGANLRPASDETHPVLPPTPRGSGETCRAPLQGRGFDVNSTSLNEIPSLEGSAKRGVGLTENSLKLAPFTSESVSSAKPGGDDLPFIFSGTLITAGQGVAEVLATGSRTELGKIGKALQGVVQEKTLLQKETGHLVKNLAIVGLSLCTVVVVVYGLTRGNTVNAWQDGLLAGITMAMATLPEELPVVLTIFLALGAWRISRNRVLTRRMPAVETLGAATVLCTDKTGTLTLNQMSVRQLYSEGKLFDTLNSTCSELPEEFHRLLEYGVLASKRDPFDPMEKALKQVGGSYLARTEHLHDHWTLIHEYPLSPELLALSHVWKSPDGNNFVIAAKGAPEAIADLCHFDSVQKEDLSRQVTVMANEGLRVLGVALSSFAHPDLPGEQHDFEFTFLGLVGLADPVRPTVPAAIQECYTAGVRVIMITGDYPGTAQSIARQIGLKLPEEFITGPELDAMSDGELATRIRNVNVFARVVPEQKLRIVNALKTNGEIVAMTGDGVNDAPALKAAHIGIAMGGRGTDVARESSALVLLDDDFASIVQAVKMGRRIFDNIKKAISYIFAVHVPIAGLSMIPVFLTDWPLLLLPVHVVFLELIIDPACSVIFEAENAESDVMRRPPRNSRERLFGVKTVAISVLQGVSVLAVVLGVLAAARYIGHPEEDTRRALAFTTLVVANLCLILTNRSWSRSIISMFREPNRALWVVLGGAIAGMSLILAVPFLRKLFHFTTLHVSDIVLCMAAGIVSIMWFEMLKFTAFVTSREERQ